MLAIFEWLRRLDEKLYDRRQAILEVFAKDPEVWQTGYELSRKLGIRSAPVYISLTVLRKQKLVEDRWEATGKRVYRLTTEGMTTLQNKTIGPWKR